MTKTEAFEEKIKKQRELRRRIEVFNLVGGGSVVMVGSDSGAMKMNLRRTTKKVIEDNQEAIKLLANM